MATVAQLEAALMKADAAGDDAAAREIAAEIKRVRVAPRKKTSRTAAVISGIERGMKPVAEALDYLNPLSYIPFGRQSEQTKQQLGTQGARAQKDRPNYFTGGKIAGEVLATAPVSMGVGTGIRLGGKALTNVAPRVATALEKVGRATVTGGAGVRAPTKTAVATGKNVVGKRAQRMLTRAAGGVLASVPAALLTDNDMVEAAAAGALVPVLGHMAKFGAGKTFDALAGRLGEVRAAEILRELVSGNADAITKALGKAPKRIKANTAEFLASKNLLTPEIAAVTRVATAGKSGGELLDVATERAAAQKIVRDRLRGGETQTNAMTNIATAKRQLQEETGLQRDKALGLADVGRLQINPAEQEAAAAYTLARELTDNARRLTGASKNFGDSPMFTSGADQATYSAQQAFADARTAEDVAANLRAQGLAPLDVSKVVANLRAEADKAEFVSPDRYKILSEFANNLQRRAAKLGGTIDATGLNLARREMSAFVSSILGTSDPKALRQGTAQLVAAAQKPIDEAIDAAAGTPPGQIGPYRKYLNDFSGGMKNIERQEFQRQLTKLPEARFVKVMEGDDTDFLEDFFGPGRGDINVELQGPALATAKKLASDIKAQRAVAQTGLQDLSQSQRLNFAQGAQARVGEMLEPPNAFAAGARVLGSVPKVGGGGFAAAQAAEKIAERSSENVMEKLVPALAQPSRARSLLETRSAEDYANRLLYGGGEAPVRQNLMAQTAVRPFNQPSDFEFPEFDPESGEPLVDIDYSEGYPVPIYGRLSKEKQFKNVNMMRR
jgi:hypothetical protein